MKKESGKCEYIAFSQDAPSELRLIGDETIENVVIRPLSKKISCSWKGSMITIPICENLNSMAVIT